MSSPRQKRRGSLSASISVRRSSLCNRNIEILQLTKEVTNMKRFTFVAMICCFVVMALAITPKTKADEFNKKTILTFTEPFEVPGVDAQILPAGTYVFKIVDSISDRDIVQISNAEETH